MIAKNTFQKGVDSDSSLKDVRKGYVRKMTNLSLSENEGTDRGSFGDVSNIKGTAFLTDLAVDPGDKFNILGSVRAYCKQGGIRNEGIVYFVKDDISNYIYFRATTGAITTFFVDVTGDLNWGSDDVVEAEFYSDNDGDYIYFVDGTNVLRKIELDDSLGQPDAREMQLQPVAPIDFLKFNAVTEGGALLSGSYIYVYRYYHTEKCWYSAWSSPTNPVPIIPDGIGSGLNPNDADLLDRSGGKVGTPTNKKVTLTIPTNEGKLGFNAVQLLVIPYTDGSKERSLKGKMFYPNESWYPNGIITHSGNESGVEVDLADILVDKMPVMAARSVKRVDNRLFVGNFSVPEYDGNPLVTEAYTIKQPLDYADEKATVENKSYFRGEEYVFGALYKDEFGTGVVFPLDLSSFSNANAELNGTLACTVTVTANGATIDVGALNVPFGTTIGDGVLVDTGGSGIIHAIDFTNGLITVLGSGFVNGAGNVTITVGDRRNHGSSFPWKFPERHMTGFTLFNQGSFIEALGLKIKLKDHPSWAKSVEIVRLRRKANIITQVPHIPTVAIQGVETDEANDGAGNVVIDYNGEYDTLMPKNHFMGMARNIIRTIHGGSSRPVPQWRLQIDEDGDQGIPKVIVIPDPGYIYNSDGESIDLNDLDGLNIEIADACILEKDRIHVEAAGSTGNALVTYPESIDVYHALGRNNYFYHRSGPPEINGVPTFGTKIEDVITLFDDKIKIRSSQEVPYLSPLVSLQHPPLGNIDRAEKINTFGAADRLVVQQGEHPSVPPAKQIFFSPGNINQRLRVAELTGPLRDFSYDLFKHRIDNNNNYFPNLGWFANPNVITNDYLEEANFLGATAAVNYEPAVNNNQMIGGAYILNLTKGLGSDRYGEIGNLDDDWIRTGAYSVLTEDDITNNNEIELNAFGGDCFIDYHELKLTEHNVRILQYDPIDSELSNALGAFAKVGRNVLTTEVIKLYLESTINPRFKDERRHLDGIENFTGEWTYEYNPGYVRENDQKQEVSHHKFCDDEVKLKNSVAWSDLKVVGASPTPIIDTQGWNIFRSNNVWTLDGGFGEVETMESIGSRDLHVFQSNRVAFLPVGIDEIEAVDGAILAVGTGKAIGSGDFYIPKEFGTQHPKTVKKRDGMIYWVDANRKAVLEMGSRGSNFKVISWDGFNNQVRDFLSNFYTKSGLAGMIDPIHDRYIFHSSGSTEGANNGRGGVYNYKMKVWEGEIDYPSPIQDGNSPNDNTVWMVSSDGKLWNALATSNRNNLFGVDKPGTIEIVVNDAYEVNKIFESLAITANRPMVQCRVKVINEDGTIDLTPYRSLDITPRNGKYLVKGLRIHDASGRTRKVRAHCIIVEIQVPVGDQVIISSLETSIRKNP